MDAALVKILRAMPSDKQKRLLDHFDDIFHFIKTAHHVAQKIESNVALMETFKEERGQ